MVVEHEVAAYAVNNINFREAKSTWDAVHSSSPTSSGVKRTKQSSSVSSSSKKLQQEAPAPDPWGPVLKNRQHFVDMHFC